MQVYCNYSETYKKIARNVISVYLLNKNGHYNRSKMACKLNFIQTVQEGIQTILISVTENFLNFLFRYLPVYKWKIKECFIAYRFKKHSRERIQLGTRTSKKATLQFTSIIEPLKYSSAIYQNSSFIDCNWLIRLFNFLIKLSKEISYDLVTL